MLRAAISCLLDSCKKGSSTQSVCRQAATQPAETHSVHWLTLTQSSSRVNIKIGQKPLQWRMPTMCTILSASTSFEHHTEAHAVSHRSEEHTSELQSLMRISYAVFCLQKKKNHK